MKNTIQSPAILAALSSKLKTLEDRIERYTAYLERDDYLLANSKYPKKYERRRRNHAAKLERYKENAARIRETLNA